MTVLTSPAEKRACGNTGSACRPTLLQGSQAGSPRAAKALSPTGALAFRAAGQIDDDKRIAFVTVPLKGHMRVAVELAADMARRGYAVDLLISAAGVTGELRALEHECPGLTLHVITEGHDLITKVDWARIASSTGRLGGSTLALMQEFVRACDGMPEYVVLMRAMLATLARLRPGLIVLDHALKLVQLWAEGREIPTVVMHTPYFLTGAPTGCAFMDPDQSRKLGKFMKEQDPLGKLDSGRQELGIAEGPKVTMGEGADGQRPGEGFAPHTLVFCEPELLNEPSVPPRVHVVGPCLSEAGHSLDGDLAEWLQDAEEQRERVLYVALGTLSNGFLTAAAVGTLLDAFDGIGEDWRVLWSLPEAQQPLLGQSGRSWDAQRLRVEAFVPQRAVLAHPAVQLFLTHGGQTSVNEGLAAGLPLLCMPLFCDQYEMAEALDRHGLGLVFHKDELLAGRHARLAELLVQAVEEPRFRQTARRHAQLMRLRGGCRRAAEVLESILHVGVDFQELWRGADAAPQITAARGTRGVLGCLQGVARLCAGRQ